MSLSLTCQHKAQAIKTHQRSQESGRIHTVQNQVRRTMCCSSFTLPSPILFSFFLSLCSLLLFFHPSLSLFLACFLSDLTHWSWVIPELSFRPRGKSMGMACELCSTDQWGWSPWHQGLPALTSCGSGFSSWYSASALPPSLQGNTTLE